LSGTAGLTGLSAVSSTSSLSFTVVLTTSDTIGNADFNQGFTPGNTLSFQFDLTTLGIDITSSSPSISTYSGTDPPATPQGTAAPEPSTLLLFSTGLALLGIGCRRLRLGAKPQAAARGCRLLRCVRGSEMAC